jgi:hypothetical protein
MTFKNSAWIWNMWLKDKGYNLEVERVQIFGQAYNEFKEKGYSNLM